MSWKKVAFIEDVATLSSVAPVDVTKAAAAAGSATDASRQDHKHDVTTGVPGTIGESDSPAEGTATSLARSDHVHGSPASYTPAIHATSHEEGGADEISVAALSGELADPQPPKTHAANHKDAGADELLLHELGEPTGSIEINKQSLVNPVLDPQADDPVTPADYQIYTKTADKHLYVYIPA